jgi:branched-chain amino acid transport system permease protein
MRLNTNSRRGRREKLARYVPFILVGVVIIMIPFMSTYIQSMMTKILIYAIFALSLNILFGYTGLFSLGHAAFFGVAGYTAGILMVHLGIKSFWIVAPTSILMAAFIAAIFGIIALRARGVYFLLVTLALGELLSAIAMRWRSVTGGMNGLSGIPYADLGLPQFTLTSTSFFYLVLVVFIACLFLLYRLINSPFGYALQGIRDDERRMANLGYNTWLYKYLSFIVSGVFAGVAGLLFAQFSSILAPQYLGVVTSTIVMLMVIIGSTTIFYGPAIGAAVVVVLEHVSSLYVPERWPLILGGVFIIAVMFLRGGITIHLNRLWRRVIYGHRIAKN